MGKIANSDYFRTKSSPAPAGRPEPERRAAPVRREVGGPAPDNTVRPAARKGDIPPVKKKETAAAAASRIVTASRDLTADMKKIIGELRANGSAQDAEAVESIYKEAVRERFFVAVVGEFSRGKSTFVNRILEREVVCTGNLPTTALMTRIRYSEQERIVVFNENGQKVNTLPADISSWENYTYSGLPDEELKGTAVEGINSEWLKKYSLEIIDTPGAGDLEKDRMQQIGQTLLQCDGAIVTVSATSPMSMSEKLFVEERLITRKVPYIMLIITKLDQINKEERPRVIRFVIEKLKLWGLDVPVFVPYDIEMPDSSYDNIIGMDKVRRKIESWICDPRRVDITTQWIAGKTADVLKSRISLLKEQKVLLEADGSGREKLINEKNAQIEKAQAYWDELKRGMADRCTKCTQMMSQRIEKASESTTERLQYEASHASLPQKWWDEDYPYRLKIELANMSATIDRAVTNQIAQDASWFNNSLEKSFRTHIIQDKNVSVMNEEVEIPLARGANVKLADIETQRNLSRVGTAALSIAGAFLCTTMGMYPLIATMGIGTGAGIFTEKIFKGKIEDQRNEIKSALAVSVPQAVRDSTADSIGRLRGIYFDMIERASEKEEEWLRMQKDMIAESISKADDGKTASLDGKISAYEGYLKMIEKY